MNTEELLFTKVAMLESKVDALQTKLASIQTLLVEALATIKDTQQEQRNATRNVF